MATVILRVMIRRRPSFGHFAEQKKRGLSPALDRLRLNESTEAFFWSRQR